MTSSLYDPHELGYNCATMKKTKSCIGAIRNESLNFFLFRITGCNSLV